MLAAWEGNRYRTCFDRRGARGQSFYRVRSSRAASRDGMNVDRGSRLITINASLFCLQDAFLAVARS